MASEARAENLEGLIERLREEGLEPARKEAEELLAKAHAEADEIRARAGEEADVLVREAQERADRETAAGRRELERAARDVLLGLRAAVEEMFACLLRDGCREGLDGALFEELLRKAVANLPEGQGPIEIRVQPEDLPALEEHMVERLRRELKRGVEIKAQPGLGAGFWCGNRGSGFYWDCTDEALAEALASQLRPRLAELLQPPPVRCTEPPAGEGEE